MFEQTVTFENVFDSETGSEREYYLCSKIALDNEDALASSLFPDLANTTLNPCFAFQTLFHLGKQQPFGSVAVTIKIQSNIG